MPKEKEITPIIISKYGGGNFFSVWTPTVICNFFSEFGKNLSPRTILDPCAGVGELLKLTLDSCWKDTKATAIEIDEKNFKKLQNLTKDYNLTCIRWDSLVKLPSMDTKFDFIIWDPPFYEGRMYCWANVNVDTMVKKLEFWKEVVLESINKINDWWYAIFTNTTIFINQYELLKTSLKMLGIFGLSYKGT